MKAPEPATAIGMQHEVVREMWQARDARGQEHRRGRAGLCDQLQGYACYNTISVCKSGAKEGSPAFVKATFLRALVVVRVRMDNVMTVFDITNM